jgi:alpha/beta superfamily hydrolase
MKQLCSSILIPVLFAILIFFVVPSSFVLKKKSPSHTKSQKPVRLVSSSSSQYNNRIMPSSAEQAVTLPESQAPGLLANLQSDVAVIITHPWGPLGGNLHNNVVTAAALFFQKKGISTLRFDFVGWQLSRGTYQVQQVEEAAQFLLSFGEKPPKHILLVGYSYGSLISASASANIPQCIGQISIAPPFGVKHWLLLFNSNHHLEQAKSREALPRFYVIGDCDNFTSKSVFLQTVDTFPKSTTTGAVLKNADHFYNRRESDVMNAIREWLLKTFPKCQGDLKKLATSSGPLRNM